MVDTEEQAPLGPSAGAFLPALNWGDPVDRDGEFLLPVGTVSLLLADVEGSTRAWEESETVMAEEMVALSDTVSEAVGRNNGVRPLEQGEGDSFLAAFARASEAVVCALDIQRALVEHGPLALRIGIHTGEAHTQEDKTYAGPAVNRAARLRDTAHGGQVVLSRATAELVSDRLPEGVVLVDLGSHRLKDLSRAEHVFQLTHPDLRADFPPLRSLDAYRHNLPEHRTPLFGRQRETAEVEQLLGNERFVTLTGGGGCGKTRLGLHVAARSLDSFPDGVFFADLTVVADDEAVARAITDAFGLGNESEAVLVPYVRDKATLLVLDNCEHVVGGCAQIVDRLLEASPAIRVLATSREPLGVAGEVTYRVPSLDVPPDETPSGIESLLPYAAVELFCDRARRARADFDPTAADAAAIAEICRRLDGVPLAIELAAARVRAFTPSDIAAGLDERFRILTGGSRTAVPRQQTLKASIDWSYDLLTEPERAVFRRLGVFPATFAIDAAQDVCAADDVEPHQVVDQLMLLVDKSLVIAEDRDGSTRFRMLESIREYAARLLERAGEKSAASVRFRDHYLRVVIPALEPCGPDRFMDAWQQIGTELANIQRAYRVSLERDEATAIAVTACGLIIADWGAESGVRATGFAEEVLTRLDNVEPATRVVFLSLMTQRRLYLLDPAVGAYMEADRAWCEANGHIGRVALLDTMARALTFGPSSDRSGIVAPLDDAWTTADHAGDHLAKIVIGSMLWLVVMFVAEDLDPKPFIRRYLEAHAVMGPDIERMTVINAVHDLNARGEIRAALAMSEELTDISGLLRSNHAESRAAFLSAIGRPIEARAAADEAIAVANEFGSDRHLGWALVRRASLEELDGSLDEAVRIYRAALEVLARADSPYTFPVIARAHCSIANIAMLQRNGDLAERSIAAARSLAVIPHVVPRVDLTASALARHRGDLEAAEQAAHDALAPAARMGFTNVVDVCLELLAGIAARQESFDEAVRLFGAAQELRDASGDLTRFRPYRDWYDEDLELARSALGPSDFRAAWDEGAATAWRDAVAYAQRGRGERKRPSHGWASLTPTEVEVVKLVREGLTNPKIAERLFVAPSTVKFHVSQIFAKLGITSRAELAAQATQRGI